MKSTHSIIAAAAMLAYSALAHPSNIISNPKDDEWQDCYQNAKDDFSQCSYNAQKKRDDRRDEIGEDVNPSEIYARLAGEIAAAWTKELEELRLQLQWGVIDQDAYDAEKRRIDGKYLAKGVAILPLRTLSLTKAIEFALGLGFDLGGINADLEFQRRNAELDFKRAMRDCRAFYEQNKWACLRELCGRNGGVWVWDPNNSLGGGWCTSGD